MGQKRNEFVTLYYWPKRRDLATLDTMKSLRSIQLNSVLAAFAFASLATAWGEGAALTTHDRELRHALNSESFTGRVESTLKQRLGWPLDPAKAELGRLLFFDKFGGLRGDNSCAGCHSPLNGFGDSVSMAIGAEDNDFVGPNRVGPRNQRRSRTVADTAFYPKLMWNGRFSATFGDPFDNSQGLLFPAPEDATRFPANDPDVVHLLQAHIPPTLASLIPASVPSGLSLHSFESTPPTP